MRLVIPATLVAVSCYSPSIAVCQYACDSEQRCPSGLACNAAGMCAASSEDTCRADDAGGERSEGSGSGGSGSGSCEWHVSNVDACALGADHATVVWTVENKTVLIDTDNRTSTDSSVTVGSATEGSGSGAVAVIAVAGLTFDRDALVTITGTTPLVILVHGAASIEGNIFVGPSTVLGCPASSAPGDGANAGSEVAGGGGATFNGSAKGAPGGTATNGTDTATGGAQGTARGETTDIPLLAGCPGGHGGAVVAANAPAGGPGGGAIQISALDSVTVGIMGVVNAPGGGGAAGTLTTGGGGGGTGGSVLLEAPAITNDGKVCANGGAGGGGGSNSKKGQDGTCNLAQTAAVGGMATVPQGSGGNGSISNTNATGGGNGTRNGGGGGGGGGRIHFEGSASGSGVISPPLR